MNFRTRHYVTAFCRRSCKHALCCALPLLAAAGAVRAQGSVTLYGTLDTSIEVTNPGNGWTARMDSGAYRGSRFGLRGNEPIGDGTSVIFDLESGFGSNNGALDTAGTLFNRQAWIRLARPWGETRFGPTDSPRYITSQG